MTYNKYLGRSIERACDRCNDCLATRRRGWVARCCAEKQTMPQAVCVTLTYDETTQENRDAARFFAYSDFSDFLKRLRAAQDYKRPGSRVRFVCAGEQGEKRGRCHWHAVIYSDLDLREFGPFSVRGQPVTDWEAMLTKGKRKVRLHWPMWGKGFVTLQEANEASIAYVLSYCLKDQFTNEKSVGTMREHKAENFSTGLFRPSKFPPIGSEYIGRKLAEWEARGVVLPNTQITIPGLEAYWFPAGYCRKQLLHGFRRINEKVRAETGQDCAQWSSLVASCQQWEKDLEVLYGEVEEQQEKTKRLRAARERNAGKAIDWGKPAESVPVGCNHALPCARCLAACDEKALAAFGLSKVEYGGGHYWRYSYSVGRSYSGQKSEKDGGYWDEFDVERFPLPWGYVNAACEREKNNGYVEKWPPGKRVAPPVNIPGKRGDL